MRVALAVIAIGLMLVTPTQAAKRAHCISSITGKFVANSYAKAHPKHTVCRKS